MTELCLVLNDTYQNRPYPCDPNDYVGKQNNHYYPVLIPQNQLHS